MLTGLIVLVPDILTFLFLLVAYFISPDNFEMSGEFSFGLLEFTAESVVGYFGVFFISLLFTVLWVLILASISSIVFKNTQLGNIWISRNSQEQMKMKKTFD